MILDKGRVFSRIRLILTGSILYVASFLIYTDLLYDRYKDHTALLTGTADRTGVAFMLAILLGVLLLLDFMLHRARVSADRHTVFKCIYLLAGAWLYVHSYIRLSMILFLFVVFVFHLFSHQKITSHLLLVLGCGILLRMVYFSSFLTFRQFSNASAQILSFLLKPFYNASFSMPYLLLQRGGGIYQNRLFVDSVKFLVVPFLTILGCYSIYLLLQGQVKRMFLFILCSYPVYLMCVAGNTLSLSLQDYSFPMQSLYLHRPFLYLSCMIPVFVLCYDDRRAIAGVETAGREKRLFRVLVGISIFCALSVITLKNDHGVKDYGKLVFHIDEVHSQWEKSYVDFLPDLAAPEAENNYSSFVRELALYGEVRLLVSEKDMEAAEGFCKADNRISAEKMNDLETYVDRLVSTDVLIMKCVTSPLTAMEIQKITDFVRRGGNLLLIGEHTNIFFMNTMINSVAERFGFSFASDSTVTLEGAWIFSEPEEIMYHPVTFDISHFMWATNCSIKVFDTDVKTLIRSPLASFSEEWEYWNASFFSSLIRDSTDDFGEKPILVARNFGRGKVAGFGDSTDFNNYMLYTSGKREFIQGLVRWFSSAGGRDLGNLLILLAINALLSFVFVKSLSRVSAEAIPFMLVFAGIFSFYCVDFQNRRPGFEGKLPEHMILFDSSHAPVPVLFNDKHVKIMGDRSYDMFFMEIGRTGLPRFLNERRRLDRLNYDRISGMVLISPRKPYSRSEISLIREQVRHAGKTLLMICGPGRGLKNMNDLAGEFGVNFSEGNYKTGCSYLQNTSHLEGGTPVLVKNGTCVASWVDFGNGKVLCISDDLMLTKSAKWFSEKGFQNFTHEFTRALFLNRDKGQTREVLGRYFY